MEAKLETSACAIIPIGELEEDWREKKYIAEVMFDCGSK